MNLILKLPKGKEIYTDLRLQVGDTGRPFRLIGVVKVTTKPSKVDYDKKITYWHWVLEYRYTDKSNLQEGFNIEIDYFDNFFSFDKIN
jgi:hypothetical protein